MPKLRKTLPKEFRKDEPAYTIAELEELFARCEVDAVGPNKATALAFDSVDVDGARWLLDRGADVDAPDRFDSSPLTMRVRWRDSFDVVRLLIERGADPDRRGRSSSPLLSAATHFNLEAVRVLLDAGADPAGAVGRRGDTPLGRALTQMKDYHAPLALELARILVPRGATVDEESAKYMRRTMSEVQRRVAADRGGEETLATLMELFELVGVEPAAPPRVLADGESITVTTEGWKAQYGELWKMLVPCGGPAESVQGEVVRIAGRIGNEILNNGGNWDGDYEAMLQAYGAHVRTGVPLDEDGLARIDLAISDLKGGAFDEAAIDDLTEFSVAWVLRNPDRTPLSTPLYQR